jgi:hypothetical protein
MVQFSVEDYQSRSDISETFSWQQTTQDQSEGESGNERSYFEEDAKVTICGVSPNIFWFLLVVFLALAVGGIIGGVIAAVEINKSKHTARYAQAIVFNWLRGLTTDILFSPFPSSPSTLITGTPTITSIPTTSPSGSIHRRRWSLHNHKLHQR